jgi:hypothetical protein
LAVPFKGLKQNIKSCKIVALAAWHSCHRSRLQKRGIAV